jgi:hypothetical protein
MVRRLVSVAVTGAVIGGAALAAAPVASASTSYPPPCPPRKAVVIEDGTIYVSVGCATVAVPGPVTG